MKLIKAKYRRFAWRSRGFGGKNCCNTAKLYTVEMGVALRFSIVFHSARKFLIECFAQITDSVGGDHLYDKAGLSYGKRNDNSFSFRRNIQICNETHRI